MSHHVTLSSLVLSYKRATEGQGVASRQALAALMGFSAAVATPLPDLGVVGGDRARVEMMVPFFREVASDATELLPFDAPLAEDLANGIYANRYDCAWGRHRTLETFSTKQIIVDTFGEDVYQTVSLWAERFVTAMSFYYHEKMKAEG